MSYTNSLWGGTERGYLYLSDSNYDWGQGLLELARWQSTHGGGTLDVWYFGSDPRVGAPPLRLLPLHIMPIEQPQDVLAYAHGRLAVGTTFLYGTDVTEAHRQAATFLRTLEPVGRTTTFFIYDLSQANDRLALPTAALTHAHLSAFVVVGDAVGRPDLQRVRAEPADALRLH